MTFGSVIRILVVGCLVGPDLTEQVAGPPPGDYQQVAPTPPGVPNCGGFSVRKFAGLRKNANNILLFQDVITNLGGWDQSTGVFTAPCNGAYFFSFNIILPQSDDFELALMKESIIQLKVFGNTFAQRETNSALVLLQHGEKVYLQLLAGPIPRPMPKDGFTSFTGFRITL